jgi:hypothetical protein
MNDAPLLLLFDAESTTIASSLNEFENSVDWLTHIPPPYLPGAKRSFLNDGVSLTWQIVTDVLESPDYQNIFTSFRVDDARCAIALALDEHVASGQRSAPIVRNLLSAGAMVADRMSANAILWRPGRLLSDVNFFLQSVQGYCQDGVFPVLSTVGFDLNEQESSLLSQGLSWFSGQEVKLICNERKMDRVELTKRAVRLVHDIAVNGPVLQAQSTEDIDINNILMLSVNQSATLVTAEIVSKTGSQ